MTREQHIVLYNIGMGLIHGGTTGTFHLCPNKRDYEYFVYWDKVSENSKIKFGAAVGHNRIQIRRETGEEMVSLEEAASICGMYTAEERIAMVCTPFQNKKTYVNAVTELDGIIAISVKRMAIEKTLVFFKNFEEWRMPMADFIDVFDEEALIVHFKSLFLCFLEEISLGNSGKDVIARLIELFKNWEQIFNERERVRKQVLVYIDLAARGIEKAGGNSGDLGYLQWGDGILPNWEQEGAAGDFLSFLLPDKIARGQFQECVTVLSAFLQAYAKEKSTALLPYIQKYEIENLQVNQIRRLGQLNLSLPHAKIANADIIKRYLRNSMKCGGEKVFECVA